MKTVSNSFTTTLELRHVGDQVVSIRFNSSLSFHPLDFAAISEELVRKLLPCDYCFYRLYDGSFIVCDAKPSVIDRGCCSIDIPQTVLMQDGVLRDVSFRFAKSDIDHADFVIGESRYISLSGVISVDIPDDHEEVEE